MSGAAVLELDEGNFEQVLARGAPVLVDFWSEFCSPCVEVGRAVEELASLYGARVIVGKVDVLVQPNLARRCGVSAVPTLIIYVRGQAVRRMSGARPKSHIARELAAWIE